MDVIESGMITVSSKLNSLLPNALSTIAVKVLGGIVREVPSKERNWIASSRVKGLGTTSSASTSSPASISSATIRPPSSDRP